eukprot:gnl/Chilomastix_cuspidata/660.p1 GENE.gnl/Chilomastix_cuspidata/660~~gnl/Chilomastix_cuspidata/660.p1  ORF type:complete len:358 (-),score=130.28 gnl/Chilomastix_cuspidata/660:399-1400(-)
MHAIQTFNEVFIDATNNWNLAALIVALPFCLVPFILYVFLRKTYRYYLIKSTLYIGTATFLNTASFIGLYFINDSFAQSYPDVSMQLAACKAVKTISLAFSYYICFWCASIGIFFIITITVMVRAGGQETIEYEKRVFFVTNIVSVVLAVAVPVVLIACDLVGFHLIERSDGDYCHCEIVWNSADIFMADADHSVSANFVFFDIPSLICAVVAFTAIVYGLVVVLLHRSKRSSSCPTKHYFFMFGVTLALFIVMATPSFIYDYFVQIGEGEEHLTRFLQVLLWTSSIFGGMIAYPIWFFTIYRQRQVLRKMSGLTKRDADALADVHFSDSASY